MLENILNSSNPIEKDLYHRAPYLLLDEIMNLSDTLLVAKKALIGDEFFFKGHFPNAPILPGALMQEMTTQAAGVLIARKYNPMGESYDTENFDPERPALGVLSRIKDAKFKSFARPGDILTIEVELIEKLENAFEFKGVIKKEKGSEVIMKNHFLLTNISSSLLVRD
ncbi:MAG: hypothetical protein K9K67_03320 [Bacteriovoracaceae bacterium]|nr:hypothetical protein [Bacteriovoracaceae bacterium]